LAVRQNTSYYQQRAREDALNSSLERAVKKKNELSGRTKEYEKI
jgi:hypothetical protein